MVPQLDKEALIIHTAWPKFMGLMLGDLCQGVTTVLPVFFFHVIILIMAVVWTPGSPFTNMV